jgi:glycosyltransferase involved in cell wall biosynthesis
LVTEYEKASVLLHLARYESFGYPLIEAAALSVPIVATATGIAPELLTGELARFLVAGDDPVACARALAEAASGRSRIGRALNLRYQMNFTRDHMVKAYLLALERDRDSGASTAPARLHRTTPRGLRVRKHEERSHLFPS